MSVRLHTKAALTPTFIPTQTSLLQRRHTLSNSPPLVLQRRPMQAKLRINQPGDIYEQEADRVAQQMVSSPPLHRKCKAPCPLEEEKKKLLQRKNNEVSTGTPVSNDLIQNLGPGQPLNPAMRTFFEPRFGHDFSKVRVHTDAQAAESARAVNARAFTAGRDVVFGKGEYAPGTGEGQRLLAHELTHVVQQSDQSIQNNLKSNGKYIQLQEEEYFGPSGWLHKEIYEPLQRDYSEWMILGNKLSSKWGEKVPIAGHAAGSVAGFIPLVLGGTMKTIVAVPQFITPKTQEELFLSAMTFGAGTPAMHIGGKVKFGYLWIKNLFRKNPALEKRIVQTAPTLVEEIIEKAEQKAPKVVEEISASKAHAEATGSTIKSAVKPSIAGAEEITLTQAQYQTALNQVFPSHYLNPITQTVEGIGQRAAARAVEDPRFIQAVQSRNWKLAGTLFHSAARQDARAIPATALPSGWKIDAERVIQAGAGGSRADILLRGPGGQIIEFDWKTTGSSALSTGSISEMTKHAGQIIINIGGNLTTQESRSWIDFVRPLLPSVQLP